MLGTENEVVNILLPCGYRDLVHASHCFTHELSHVLFFILQMTKQAWGELLTYSHSVLAVGLGFEPPCSLSW